MRKFSSSVVCLGLLLSGVGCTVQFPASQASVQPAADSGPEVQAPGVVVFNDAPPVAERVYVYDPGYPPGTYFYNGGYVYNGYYYPHDVYVNRVVAMNVRENRYTNVTQNRYQTTVINNRTANNNNTVASANTKTGKTSGSKSNGSAVNPTAQASARPTPQQKPKLAPPAAAPAKKGAKQ